MNLSGNKRLPIKPDSSRDHHRQSRDLGALARESLAGFSFLHQIRVLGLIDINIDGMNEVVDIPDETEDRRVRTSLSTVNGMAYGIADTLGKFDHLNMLDLVHEFPNRKNQAVFAMFGRSEPPKSGPGRSNRLAKFLHDGFVGTFSEQLDRMNGEADDDILDTLRRTFMILNQDLHEFMFSTPLVVRKFSNHSAESRGSLPDFSSTQGGASGVVLYFRGKTMYIANTGNILAVISRTGTATLLSRKHVPYDPEETTRIRTTEGWVSPLGLVNDESDLSRSFGFFHLMPTVNARPHLESWSLSEQDEFVIIGNRGLWDYVSYQTAVDIARGAGEPMIAAQKLRDLAISYGAEGTTMIMVITVGDLFNSQDSLSRD